ncbi:unnamed protein product [Chironomus riparius]|uniref:Uncharacterized protein n=1 Tax=Chironomus riparius TaxID=315576 RepID=A0A9N9WLV2_9DIPT|nr:unnamed protein product [Chironomus riparius]
MNNDAENGTDSQTPVRTYRRMGESAMKKVVILGGSTLLCILFSLIITVNVIDTEWEAKEKLISLIISTIGLVIFFTVIITYIIFHAKKGRRDNSEDNTITEPQAIPDNPPTYDDIMGKLPSYESYSKSTAKNISSNDYVCHV